MNDIQTCLASFAVASGARGEHGTDAVDRSIDAYLADAAGDRIAAIVALKAAFEAMMLDGSVAAHISSRIDAMLSPASVTDAGEASFGAG